MIYNLTYDDSELLLSKLANNKKGYRTRAQQNMARQMYKDWTKIHSLEKVQMPVGRTIGGNYETSLSDAIKVYHEFLLYGSKETGSHYIYPHQEYGYEILEAFLIMKTRESNLDKLGI